LPHTRVLKKGKQCDLQLLAARVSILRCPLIVPVAIVLASAGCGRPSAPDNLVAERQPGPDDVAVGEWVGTMVTDAGITTVVNESGSLWGGAAELVEEASIGVSAGTSEYMLGLIGGIHLTEDRIYVTDTSVPTLRVYDHDGRFIETIGRPGQGPGEYTTPTTVTTAPDGRIFLYDMNSHRVNVYSPTGESIDTYPGRVTCCLAMRVDDSGRLWAPFQRVSLGAGREIEQRYGIRELGPDAAPGSSWELLEPAPDDIQVQIPSRRPKRVPFSPTRVWAVAEPATVVVGTGAEYQYSVQREGRIVRIVKKSWEPVAIREEHISWARDLFIASVRQVAPADWEWDGAEMPPTQPAFTTLAATATGEVWVRRPGDSTRAAECSEDPIRDGSAEARRRPCWSTEWFLDVFDAEGRLMGSLVMPKGFSSIPRYLDALGDNVVSLVEDDAGTIMVKRYRLVGAGGVGF